MLRFKVNIKLGKTLNNFLNTFLLFLLTALTLISGCSKNSPIEPYEYPTKISGQVKNAQGTPLNNAKVSLLTALDFSAVFTNSQGFFILEKVPEGKHRIKVEIYGYENFEGEVPSAVNGISTINPVLVAKSYNVPTVKPISKGPVRILNNKLEVDFDNDGLYKPFFIKGVAFSPTPIGNRIITLNHEDRSVQFLVNLNANTIRTYSGVSFEFLQKLSSNNIYCIVGFWVDYFIDLSVEQNRQNIKDQFILLVTQLKDSPGLLMWTLGNEQNYQNGNNPYWYSLTQELAILAYEIEGEKYHPVSINNGNIYNIGNALQNADDNSLTYIDLWATNTYDSDLTVPLSSYKLKTSKPIVFTEFGIDALDNRTGGEYENVQASFDSLNWIQIINNPDICLGGTVFEYTDEWWKAGDPYNHDNGGYPTSAHPDGYSNEEWWGLIRVLPDSDGDGLDEWFPRKVYFMFKRNWL